MWSYQAEDWLEFIGQLLVHDHIAIERAELNLCGRRHFEMVLWAGVGYGLTADQENRKLRERVFCYVSV